MNKKLYPIEFRGKIYLEKDCSDIFKSFYTGFYSLRYDKSVYVGDGMSVYPDGSWSDN